MEVRRPSGAVLYAASFQVLLGATWLVRAFEFPGALPRLLLASIAASHWIAAVGLYRLYEWGRQRAVQLAVFDVLGTLHLLLTDHISPFGALLQLGMPLYTINVLNDSETRELFT